jgi:hypothetical protein
MHNPFANKHIDSPSESSDAFNGIYLVKDLSNLHLAVETIPGGCEHAVGEICKKYGSNIEIKATTETPGMGRVVYHR